MADSTRIVDAKEMWQLVRGPENASFRKVLWRRFRKLFPRGHEESLKEILVEWTDAKFRRTTLTSDELLSGLLNIHPRAFSFIAEHGRDYTPHVWHKRPPVEPQTAACSSNAAIFMRITNKRYAEESSPRRVLYVEGVVFGPLASPMLHAWNTGGLEKKTAFDWTHYSASQWARYFGVPFTEEEHTALCSSIYKKRTSTLLFHRKIFPRVEGLLHEIIKARTNQLIR